jgi:hypothetical protein
VNAHRDTRSDGRDAAPGTLLQTMRAVAWSFFGVRRGRDHDQDMARLNPVHVVVAGIVAAVLFVAALIMIIRWIVGSGVAA